MSGIIFAVAMTGITYGVVGLDNLLGKVFNRG